MRIRQFSPFHIKFSETEVGAEVVRHSMQLAVWESLLTGVLLALTSGVVLNGFALSLGANDFVIGLLAATQVGANLLQIRALRLLERRKDRKAMAVRFAACARLVWIAIGLLTVLPIAALQPYRLWLFLALFALGTGLGIFSMVPWVSWLVDLVPEKVRGRFLSYRSFASGVAGVALGMLAGKFIDWWNAEQFAPTSHGFVVLMTLGMLVGLWAVAIINKMHAPPFLAPTTQVPFWESLKLPFRDQNFRRLFYFRILNDLSLGSVGTFLSVYMLTQAHLSFLFVTTMTTLSILTSLIALKPAGKLIDRFGNKPVLQICLLGKTLFAFLWIFTTPETFWLYVLIHLMGIFDVGHTTVVYNLLYKLSPAARRANYIAVDGTVVGIAATVAPLLGGSLALLFTNWQFTLGPFQWAHFHFLFLGSAFIRLGTFLTLRRVHEPGAKSLGYVLRMLHPVRLFLLFLRSRRLPAQPAPRVEVELMP